MRAKTVNETFRQESPFEIRKRRVNYPMSKKLGKPDKQGIYDESILPEEAIKELYAWYIDKPDDPNLKIRVFPDPQVEGTFAVRLTRTERRKPYTLDLLWNKGEYDEVEFETWPPKSGNLKFF
jgi:hypothetical protein